MSTIHATGTSRAMRCETLGDFLSALRVAREERLLISPRPGGSREVPDALTLEFLPAGGAGPTVGEIDAEKARKRRLRWIGIIGAMLALAVLTSVSTALIKDDERASQLASVPASNVRFVVPAAWLVRADPVEARVVVSSDRLDHERTGGRLRGPQIWVEDRHLAALATEFYVDIDADPELATIIPQPVELSAEAKRAALGGALLALGQVPEAVAAGLGVSLRDGFARGNGATPTVWRFASRENTDTIVALVGDRAMVFHARAPDEGSLRAATATLYGVIASAMPELLGDPLLRDLIG